MSEQLERDLAHAEPKPALGGRLGRAMPVGDDLPPDVRASVIGAQRQAAAQRACEGWRSSRKKGPLLELGLDHFAISIQLGHTDGGALVMERYGHPSVDAAKQRLQRAFQMQDDETGSAAGSVTP